MDSLFEGKSAELYATCVRQRFPRVAVVVWRGGETVLYRKKKKIKKIDSSSLFNLSWEESNTPLLRSLKKKSLFTPKFSVRNGKDPSPEPQTCCPRRKSGFLSFRVLIRDQMRLATTNSFVGRTLGALCSALFSSPRSPTQAPPLSCGMCAKIIIK